MKNVIVVEGLNKEFKRHDPDRPWTLQETVLRGLWRRRPKERFQALRDVSFEVPAGHSFGVIGANGSGKSTLLRILGGVMPPNSGTVRVDGRIGALLELGAGFHHDLTGRENVFVNGVIAGLTRREVAVRFDSIVSFAELEEAIDNPLRTYSTGMQMRLAFAIAVHVEPEILLIDEVLSVGDLAFQSKCFDRIARFRAEGCSIVLVSHDVSVIRELCDKALWLRQGRVMAQGSAEEVVDLYVAETSMETHRRTPDAHPSASAPLGTELKLRENRFGSLEMEITSVRLLDSLDMPAAEISTGDPLRVEISFQAAEPTCSPNFQVYIYREDGLVCCDLATETGGPALPKIQGRRQVVLHIDQMPLNTGLYYVDVGVYKHDWSYAYDYHWKVYPLTVRSTEKKDGVIRPPHRWEIKCHPAGETNTPSLIRS
jgi:lipopolysaccharide transport system ATP-binding protein